MQHTPSLNPAGFPIQLIPGTFSKSHSHPDQRPQAQHRDKEFVALMNAFRRSGGLARSAEVAARVGSLCSGASFPLSDWLVKRQVICVEWRETLWLPLFQFDASGLTLKAGLTAVLAELIGDRDDWSVASWFAHPNPLLVDCTPADSLATMAPAVLIAARWARKQGMA